MASSEDEVERCELRLEHCFGKADLPQLLEMGKAAGVKDMDNLGKRSVALRYLRKLVEGQEADTHRETVINLQKLLQVCEFVQAEADSKTETSMLNTTGDDQHKQATDDADPTDNLSRLMRDKLLTGDALEDKASIFRRQLKFVGIIGSAKENITYINILSQINDAKASNYSEDDICRALRKAIAGTSNLRTYFDTQQTMQLRTMTNLLRDYYRERTSAELFMELGRLCQRPGEGATDFIFRSLELRQKVIMASDAEGSSYNTGLVRETFLRSVRTGLTDLHVRTHMSPLLDPRASPAQTDEQLLREVNIASAESEETNSKQKMVTKKVTVAETAVVKTDPAADLKSTIQPLVESLATLQKQVSDLQASRQTMTGDRNRQMANHNNSSHQTMTGDNSNRPTTSNYQRRDQGPRYRDYRCQGCRDVNSPRCTHCFHCGQENHLARDCASRKN